jgi:predicted permease
MRWATRAWVRLRSIVGRGRLERELDAELCFHLDRQIAEYTAAGMSLDDARTAAARTLGSTAFVKDECRQSLGLRLLDETVQDLRYAGRTLRKNPAFTLAAVLSLALGIGANTTIFTLLDAVVFKPLPVPSASELYTCYENGPEGIADAAGGSGRYLRFSYPRFRRLQEALGSHGRIAAATRSSQFTARLPGASERAFVFAQLISGDYFETLGVRAARGRVLTAADTSVDRMAPVVVISDGFWKRAFGASESALGQTLTVNNVDVTVVGIAPPGFVGMWTDREADLWLPLTLQQPLAYANNTSIYGRADDVTPWVSQDIVAWLNLVARVPASERAQAIALLQGANRAGVVDLAATFPRPKDREGMLAHTLVVEPFAHGFSGLRARFADALFILAGLVALVLLVTCANIANLLLARAAGHAREIGIRIALGVSLSRLVRQCLAESLALALIGGAAGLLIGQRASAFLARQVIGTVHNPLPGVFAPDVRILAFAFCVTVATAIAFGLAPALRAIRMGRAAAPAGNQRQAVGQTTPTAMRSLVVAQLALSVVVVFAAMLLGRTLINFMRVDPGFEINHLAVASIDPLVSGYRNDQMPALARRLIATARGVPGVVSASVSRCGLVAGCSSTSGFRLESPVKQESVSLNVNWVTPGYFGTAGIPLVTGRDFDDRDSATAPAVAVVNQTIASQYFPGQSPIGRRLGYNTPDVQIVGVVRDARTQSLHDPPVPMVYFPVDQKAPANQAALTNVDIRVAADPAAVIPTLREALRRSEPGMMFGNVSPMSERLERDLTRERIVAYLAFGFGLLTLLLASIGVYGVLSYGVVRRTQEIGVRMALGARRIEVMGLVLGSGARMTAPGIAIGLAAAAVSARYLSGLIFGVTPLDAATFAAVCATVVSVTIVASVVPARRATKVDPLVALRSD